jgi:hypothetical protein
MIHSIQVYLGQAKDAQGRTIHRHQTQCKLTVNHSQRIAIGALVNLGAADRQKCPTCCSSMLMTKGGPDGFTGHAGSDPSLLNVSGAIHDQSHQMDGGRTIVKLTGMDAVAGNQIIASDQEVTKDGLERLKDYGRVNEDPVICEDNDPFGDGDVAFKRGAAMSGQRNAACPYKNPYLAKRWAEGVRRGRALGGG